MSLNKFRIEVGGFTKTVALFIDVPGIILSKNTVDDRDLNKEEILLLLKGVHNITDDQLKYNENVRKITIIKKGEGNKKEGTQLIRDMINHSKTVTLNYAVSEKKAEDGNPYAMPGAYSGKPGDGDDPNFYNGIGGDVEVCFGIGGTYIYQDHRTGKINKEQITLTGMMNHEFSHSIGQMDGTTRGGIGTQNNPTGKMVLHPYNDGQEVKYEKIPLEEATATFIDYRRHSSSKRENYPTENSLNKEQGGKKRLNYGH